MKSTADDGRTTLTAAVVQMNARADVRANLEEAERRVRDAMAAGAELISLPENFAYSGPDQGRAGNGEAVDGDGPILGWARALAGELDVHLLLGSVPERSPVPGKVFNTSVLLSPNGENLAVYRKVHLFEVHLEGRPGIRESEILEPGNEVVVAPTPWGPMGMSICYDLRFPGLYRKMVERGARIIAAPAAFTDVTGKAHWEVLIRARAIENLCFVIAPNLWGHHFDTRASYGHSLIVDPWGRVKARLGDGPGFAVAELDLAAVDECRARMPSLDNRRVNRL